MWVPSILFFEAAAQVIPTLFIALAFSTKAFSFNKDDPSWQVAGFEGFVGFILVLLIPFNSEAVALATLATNRPNFPCFAIVFLGVLIILGMLGYAVVEKMVEYHKENPLLGKALALLMVTPGVAGAITLAALLTG